MSEPPKIGTIGWIDLTTNRAAKTSRFYSEVVNWSAQPLQVGSHEDYLISPEASSDVIAGICHRAAENLDTPNGWMIYIVVDSVEKSAQRAVASGGSVVHGPRKMDSGIVAFLADPDGNAFAVFESIGD